MTLLIRRQDKLVRKRVGRAPRMSDTISSWAENGEAIRKTLTEENLLVPGPTTDLSTVLERRDSKPMEDSLKAFAYKGSCVRAAKV